MEELQAPLFAAGEAADALLVGYRPLPGVHDELLDDDGRPRAHWRPLLDALAGLGSDELGRRFTSADRYLREAGVFHRVYDDAPGGSERPWPLSHVPLLIAADEWAALSRGLVQRATLLEAVVGDLYGPQNLVRSGALPAALVAGSPEFLRPLVGFTPRGGHHLRFHAAELGRGPDGRWWVLGDRTQAPSGAGYALENRVAIGRALADVSQRLNVRRLAGFFQHLQRSLSDWRGAEAARVGLLTPGPLNETYFEHAYLARYLGFLLLEGEDLAVRNDRLYVRTVDGLRPIDVLWRRLDAGFADPLELDADSRIGVPGLVRAVRADNVLVANSLGSGLLEAPALLAFLPALCRRLLGEELALPNVATWWCGDDDARDHVLANLERLSIAPAWSVERAVAGERGKRAADAAALARQAQAIGARPTDWIGQEDVRLSTTPVWVDGRLQARPCTVRVFMVRTPDGWEVMPGAFCRISDNADARAVTMQRGSRAADVWVLSDAPAEQTTLLSDDVGTVVRRRTGALPSRAADNLYWVGRYVERADALLRLLRALATRAADFSPAHDPIQSEILADLVAYGVLPADADDLPVTDAITRAIADRATAGSLLSVIGSARHAAALVRERLSPDAWIALRELEARFADVQTAGDTAGELAERIGAGLRSVAALSGLMQENMVRQSGYLFLDLGRRIERGQAICRFAARFGRPNAPLGALEALLELADSAISYRQRYSITATPRAVLDLVVLHPDNPRSLTFQADLIVRHVHALPPRRDESGDTLRTVVWSLESAVRNTRAGEVDRAFLDAQAALLRRVSDAITRRFFSDRGVPVDPEG